MGATRTLASIGRVSQEAKRTLSPLVQCRLPAPSLEFGAPEEQVVGGSKGLRLVFELTKTAGR